MAAVPYYAGKAVCRAFDVNQRWLATGQSPRHPYVDLDTELKAEVPVKALFTEGFEDYLQKPMLEWLRLFASAISVRPEDLTDDDAVWLRVGGQVKDAADVFERLIGIGVSGMIHYIPARLRLPFVRAMCATIEKFKEEHAAEIDAWWEEFDREFEAEEKSAVDILSNQLNSPNMVKTVDELLENVKSKTTGQHGAKTALADTLGITPQQLNDWLTQRSKPSGAHVLQLLHLGYGNRGVNNKNGPERVTAPSGPVAPKGINHEEDYSSRPGTQSPGKSKSSTPQKRKPR